MLSDRRGSASLASLASVSNASSSPSAERAGRADLQVVSLPLGEKKSFPKIGQYGFLGELECMYKIKCFWRCYSSMKQS